MWTWITEKLINGLLNSQKVRVALAAFILSLLTKASVYVGAKWGFAIMPDPVFVDGMVEWIFKLALAIIAGHSVTDAASLISGSQEKKQ